MPTAKANGIELEYETFGDPGGRPLLLIMGLGAQMISWDERFCAALVERGHYVTRYDNRDVGLSTKFDDHQVDFMQAITAAASGGEVEAPYTLTDMASDAVAVLDAVGIAAGHVVGASMGGMIAQTLAIEHPDRVLSLTSIMSTTGDRDVGQPTPDAMQRLMFRPPEDRAGYLDHFVETSKVIGSPGLVDEGRIRELAGRAFDRSFNPAGVGRQLVGIMASGSRTEALRNVEVPTLVIHGSVDPLVQIDGGRRTAEAIPGAELLVIDGMGHDLPQGFWPQVVDAITDLTSRVPAAR